MERMSRKPILKPLLWTALLFAFLIACLMILFLSLSVGTAYSISSWLTTTPQVSALIYRTETANPTTVAQIQLTANSKATKPPPIPSQTPLSSPVAPTIINTETPTLEKTVAITATATSLPTAIPATPTMDVTLVQMTQEAQLTPLAATMQNYVNSLFNNQTIKSNSGMYIKLPNYSGQSKDPGNLEFKDTNLALSDFILRADITWQVDSLAGDWAESGCGIVFRADQMGNYYMIFLSLDGRGRLIRKVDGSSVMLGRSTIYDVDRNNGQAKFMLIVEGERLRYFVNDKVKYDTFAQPQLGKLEWTVVSGNKYGFGTQCQVNNIEVWKMGK